MSRCLISRKSPYVTVPAHIGARWRVLYRPHWRGGSDMTAGAVPFTPSAVRAASLTLARGVFASHLVEVAASRCPAHTRDGAVVTPTPGGVGVGPAFTRDPRIL